MSTPKLAPYNVLPLWATAANYPPGIEDWASSPTKQTPVANDFVPEEEFPAQQANALFNGLTIADVGAKTAADTLYDVSRNRDLHTWAGSSFTRHATDTSGNSDLSWDEFDCCWQSSQYNGSTSIMYAHACGGGDAWVVFRKPIEVVPYNNCDTVTGASYASNHAGNRAHVLRNNTAGGYGFRYGSPGSVSSPATNFFQSFPAPFASAPAGQAGCDCFWSDTLSCFVFCIYNDDAVFKTDVGVYTFDGSTLTDITASCGLPSLPLASGHRVRMYWQENGSQVVLAFGGTIRVPSVTVLTSPTVATNYAVGILATSTTTAHVVGLAKANDKLYLMAARNSNSSFTSGIQLCSSTTFGTSWTVHAENNPAGGFLTDVQGFGNVGETLWLWAKERNAYASTNYFRMWGSMDGGVTWERIPGAHLNNDSAGQFLGYTPHRGGMLALTNRTHFKSTLPNVQPTHYTLTL